MVRVSHHTLTPFWSAQYLLLVIGVQAQFRPSHWKTPSLALRLPCTRMAVRLRQWLLNPLHSLESHRWHRRLIEIAGPDHTLAGLVTWNRPHSQRSGRMHQEHF
ncbi:hypothetical protein BS47DRAFT_12338 [Hydnum rufescens UP504]|uniref:Secreted protein n=1 Tax=Hydnum rufescens UP504 TaxID=1448309 RepID=A0A9P6BBH8_9AGAM|nr:hypothetical protein BS47DRAFT_12338 [Hydnum rufescens UP504]